jgi:hypothetical protein
VSGGEEPQVGVDASAARGVQAGDGSTQVNTFAADRSQLDVSGGRDAFAAARDLTVINNNYATAEPEPGPPVVVGDIPQQPAAFQPRAGLMEALDRDVLRPFLPAAARRRWW